MKNIYITKSTKIIEAMKLLADRSSRCLIVTDKKKHFYGTLNDGDLRRGILKGLTGNQTIKSLYQRKPIVISENELSINLAKSLMRKNLLPILPIVNKQNIVTGYLSWNKLFGTKEKSDFLKNINIIIMAGGKGVRLAPFTKILPKPLLPIDDKPVIEHIIEKFTNYGGKNFFISVNYKSLLLMSYFKELKPNYNIKFLSEQKPLGTVGGLQAHKKKLSKNDIFLCNCDVIIESNLSAIYNFHKKRKNDLTIIASTKNYEIPYGICHLDKKGNLKKIVEKPKNKLFVNTGLYVLKPKVLNLIPKNQFFNMTELIEKAKKLKYSVGVYPINDSDWIDTGEMSAYTKNLHLDN